MRRLRSYLRQRAMLVEYASHHVQHMQNTLTQMDVKLHHVISDIAGKTRTAIIEGIVDGQRDPRKLARLRDRRIKADEATIARSLRGCWREEHIFELVKALELYRLYQDKIAECDREIEAWLERFEDRSDGEPPAPNGKTRNQENASRFDVQGHLYRVTGVDLTKASRKTLLAHCGASGTDPAPSGDQPENQWRHPHGQMCGDGRVPTSLLRAPRDPLACCRFEAGDGRTPKLRSCRLRRR